MVAVFQWLLMTSKQLTYGGGISQDVLQEGQNHNGAENESTFNVQMERRESRGHMDPSLYFTSCVSINRRNAQTEMMKINLFNGQTAVSEKNSCFDRKVLW